MTENRVEMLALKMERKSWVARNLQAARERPVKGEPLTRHMAAQGIGGPTLQAESIRRWELGQDSPGPRRIDAVVTWIADRLQIEPPA